MDGYTPDGGRPRRVLRSTVAATIMGGGFGLVACPAVAYAINDAPGFIGGIDTIMACFGGMIACPIVATIAFFVWDRRGRPPSLRAIVGISLLTAVMAVPFFLWLGTRNTFTTCLLSPMPRGVIIHEGTARLFDVHVHFSAPPEVIEAIIQSKQLAPPKTDQEKQQMDKEIRYSPGHPYWWLPESMPGRKFYLHLHLESQQPWILFIWVNDKTNEAYICNAG